MWNQETDDMLISLVREKRKLVSVFCTKYLGCYGTEFLPGFLASLLTSQENRKNQGILICLILKTEYVTSPYASLNYIHILSSLFLQDFFSEI